MNINGTAPLQFRWSRSMRLATFQVGSSMAEILTASVWNRVMIADLGMPAWPVGLLLALQYLLLPISLWAGNRSDTQRLFGYRRTSYIWLGRGTMALAVPLLGLSVRSFEAGDNVTGWLLATVCFLLFGVGKLMSGSVFLALVRESAPKEKQGIAIGLTETTLIALFPIMAIAFGRWMEVYDPLIFWEMILLTAVVGGFFWWFATVRIERSLPEPPPVPIEETRLWEKFGDIWHDSRVRLFFAFLFVSTFAAWMQDNILEPFGAEVFGLEAGQTTRFTGYWGGATIIVLLIAFAIWRSRRPVQQTIITQVGLVIMGSGMLLLASDGLFNLSGFLIPSLLIFGGGFGLYTFGALSLMAVMSPDRSAGAYLGLWTVAILVSKGLGTFAGGLFRDIFLAIGWTPAVAYGAIFFLAGIGLIVSAGLLFRLDIMGFAREYGRLPEASATPVEAMPAD